MRERGARHMEIAVDICFESAIELLICNIFQSFLALLERGVVNQDVELFEIIDCRVDSLLAEFRIADVAGDDQSTAAFVFDRGLSFFRVAF